MTVTEIEEIVVIKKSSINKIMSHSPVWYRDKKWAKYQFEKRKLKGNFVVKDLMNEFDISDIDKDYDLIIANDFLEHIANPSDVLSCYGDVICRCIFFHLCDLE